MVNRTAEAAELVKQGKYVLLEGYPVHCRYTDAVIREDIRIAHVADTREAVLEFPTHDDAESRFWVVPTLNDDLRPSFTPEPADDDVPF